jgi:SAM-dependent methyltransferase
MLKALFAAAAERNKGPILAVLERILPRAGLVLEIASGTGQHVVHFAKALPQLTWQPSDADSRFHDSIRAWIEREGVRNVLAPIGLDVCNLPWPVTRADAVLCINMIHVAPWEATKALLTGANEVLGPDGVLFLYGPFRRFGRHTAPSNEAFDAQLRANDPSWGLRDLKTVADLAGTLCFVVAEVVDMPANNISLLLKRGKA